MDGVFSRHCLSRAGPSVDITSAVFAAHSSGLRSALMSERSRRSTICSTEKRFLARRASRLS
eukprot:4397608-Prymnesium_polylepis.1